MDDFSKKPHWFIDHEEEDRRNFSTILEKLECIERKIDPVVETYEVATALGKWTKMTFAAILMLLSIIWTAISIKNNLW